MHTLALYHPDFHRSSLQRIKPSYLSAWCAQFWQFLSLRTKNNRPGVGSPHFESMFCWGIQDKSSSCWGQTHNILCLSREPCVIYLPVTELFSATHQPQQRFRLHVEWYPSKVLLLAHLKCHNHLLETPFLLQCCFHYLALENIIHRMQNH